MQRPVAVVGSANLDVVVTARARPTEGETLVADSYVEAVGGKGANQAMAAAALGPAELVGAVGGDEAGASVLAELAARGVGSAHVQQVSAPTGRAVITVTPDGENSILVVPMANGEVAAEAVVRALDAIAPAVVLVQLEIPDDAVDEARRWCAAHGARFVLNPSPVRSLPDGMLAACDPVIVNLGEARALLGGPWADPTDVAVRLSAAARSVVVTMGADGALVARSGNVRRVAAPQVVVKDTTGAGDVFAGTLAARLGAGATLDAAVATAVERAADVVRRGRDEPVSDRRRAVRGVGARRRAPAREHR